MACITSFFVLFKIKIKNFIFVLLCGREEQPKKALFVFFQVSPSFNTTLMTVNSILHSWLSIQYYSYDCQFSLTKIINKSENLKILLSNYDPYVFFLYFLGLLILLFVTSSFKIQTLLWFDNQSIIFLISLIWVWFNLHDFIFFFWRFLG